MRTSGCALCALIVVFAIGRAVAGENVRRHGLDAESQAVEMLASIGCKPGLNPATKRYAAIGLYRCFIAKDTVQEDVERIRSKGIRCALLDAKGRIAMFLAGHDEVAKHLDEDNDGYTMRLAYKAMAEMRLSCCKELPFAESWDAPSRIYSVAIPVVYNKRWGDVVKRASDDLNEDDRCYLEARVKALPIAQRTGCLRLSKNDGTEYAVAFGSVEIEGLAGKDLKRRMTKARIEAIGNMAFWLKSDICITRIAEEFFKVHGNDVTSWSEFCNRVNAECKYKDMPVNEVGFGESRNRITRRKQYWWACGVKLMSLKSMAR